MRNDSITIENRNATSVWPSLHKTVRRLKKCPLVLEGDKHLKPLYVRLYREILPRLIEEPIWDHHVDIAHPLPGVRYLLFSQTER